jgi:YHS domain-containing protein
MLSRSARAFVFVVAAGLTGACGGERREPLPPPSPPADSPVAGPLTIIEDTSQVCMVNNQYMGRGQIPVKVDGKTYYGCCPACQNRIRSEPSVRFAKDPVTGEQVDKATAVIAHDARNVVLYFASAQNVRSYTAPR